MYERQGDFEDLFNDSTQTIRGCLRPGARDRKGTPTSPKVEGESPCQKRLEFMVRNFEAGFTIDGERPLSIPEMESCGMRIAHSSKTAILPNGKTVRLSVASAIGE